MYAYAQQAHAIGGAAGSAGTIQGQHGAWDWRTRGVFGGQSRCTQVYSHLVVTTTRIGIVY